MSSRALRWVGLGFFAVLLVVSIHLIYRHAANRSTASLATLTYAWLQRQGPHGPRVTVDLYAPERSRSDDRAPLVVLLQGNDPSEPDERGTIAAGIGDSFGRSGVAVAAVAFNLDEGYTPGACAADVARVVREVADARDPRRLVLVGRGLGAWMASMLALDDRLFAGAGMDAKRVDGVIAMRGIYDVRGESSPIDFVREGAPPFLVLSGAADDARWARSARPFARALRSAGARDVDEFVVRGRDAHTISYWGGEANDLGALALAFVTSGPQKLTIESPFEAHRIWDAHPPLDLSELRKDPTIIATYPVDDELRKLLAWVFDPPIELQPYPANTYQAVDLLAYLAGRPESEVGSGSWLVVTNVRGERLYFPREALEKTRPLLVVGLDDEDNLFRISRFYRMKRAYSWINRPEPLPVMVRPLGAFLYFRTPLPSELRNRTYAPFGLDATSFHWEKTDPLAPMRSLPSGLRGAMMGGQGCLTCHTFRGVGARAHHALAVDAKPSDAFALPLDEYPTDVLRRFLFEQDAVAASFDIVPLRVERDVAEQLLELVTWEKSEKARR